MADGIWFQSGSSYEFKKALRPFAESLQRVVGPLVTVDQNALHERNSPRIPRAEACSALLNNILERMALHSRLEIAIRSYDNKGF